MMNMHKRIAAALAALALAGAAQAAGIVERLYVAPGAGAVARSQAQKGADTISVKDYGAKCDGAADDTARIAAALAATSARVYVPAGTCVATAVPDMARLYGEGSIKVSATVLPVSLIASDLSIPVPSVFPDIYSARNYLANVDFYKDVTVTISVAAGTYNVDKPFKKIRHGNQVQIIGAGSANTILKWMGPVDTGTGDNKIYFIDLEKDGHLGLIDGMTLDGNAQRGKTGTNGTPQDPQAITVRRNSSVVIGPDVLIKDWARCGVLANQGSSILALGNASSHLIVSGSFTDGIAVSAGSNAVLQYTESNGNGGNGFWNDSNGAIVGTDLKGNNNGAAAVFAYNGANYYLSTGTSGYSLRAAGNGGPAIYANDKGSVLAPRVSLTGNGVNASATYRHNIAAVNGSLVDIQGSAAGSESIVETAAQDGIYASASTVNVRRVISRTNGRYGVNAEAGAVISGDFLQVSENINSAVMSDGARMYGSTWTLSGTNAGAVANFRNGSAARIPSASITSIGANSQALAVSQSVVSATSGTLVNSASVGTNYAVFADLSGTANITGAAVTGAISPAANTAGTRNSYIHN